MRDETSKVACGALLSHTFLKMGHDGSAVAPRPLNGESWAASSALGGSAGRCQNSAFETRRCGKEACLRGWGVGFRIPKVTLQCCSPICLFEGSLVLIRPLIEQLSFLSTASL